MIGRLLLVLDSSGDDAESLLDLVRWAAAVRHVTITAVVLDPADGARTLDGVTSVRRPTPTFGVLRATAELTRRPGLARTTARRWRRRVLADAPAFDAVVVGSVEALEALDELPDPRPPVIAHLPLLDETWSGRPRPADLARRLAAVALTVVPAEPVARWATRDRADGGLGLDPRQVRHHRGPLDPPTRHPRPGRDGAALVVGCGPVGWRAGTDLFAAVASAVGTEVDGRDVRWTWIGDDDVDGTGTDVRDDLQLRGLRQRVRLTPDGPGRADRLAAADLLLVTGRVAPSPLPAVQAALAGTPVVGFTPGTDLLGEAGHEGRRVERLDVEALADQVRELLSHPDRGRLLAGDLARAAASATTPLAAPSLWADIEAAVAAVAAVAAPTRRGPDRPEPVRPEPAITSDGRASEMIAGPVGGSDDRREGDR